MPLMDTSATIVAIEISKNEVALTVDILSQILENVLVWRALSKLLECDDCFRYYWIYIAIRQEIWQTRPNGICGVKDILSGYSSRRTEIGFCFIDYPASPLYNRLRNQSLFLFILSQCLPHLQSRANTVHSYVLRSAVSILIAVRKKCSKTNFKCFYESARGLTLQYFQ